MICPQRYRTHTGSSPERQTLRLGAQPLATLGLWAVCRGALPLAALTGDVMRRARYTPATPAKVISYGVVGIVRSAADSFGCASHKGEELRPATPAKVFKSAITQHRSSSRASRHHRRASGRAETPTGGGWVHRPAAIKCAVHAARATRQRGGTTTASGDGAPPTGPPPRGAQSLGAAARCGDGRSVATRRGERMPRRGREGWKMGLASRSPPPSGVAAAPQRDGSVDYCEGVGGYWVAIGLIGLLLG